MPTAAPGKFTTEFYLTATAHAAAIAALFDKDIPWPRAIGGMALVYGGPAVYTLARTWIKKHGGPDLPAMVDDSEPAAGPSAAPLSPPASSPPR